jgi:hypothetical protein
MATPKKKKGAAAPAAANADGPPELEWEIAGHAEAFAFVSNADINARIAFRLMLTPCNVSKATSAKLITGLGGEDDILDIEHFDAIFIDKEDKEPPEDLYISARVFNFSDRAINVSIVFMFDRTDEENFQIYPMRVGVGPESVKRIRIPVTLIR